MKVGLVIYGNLDTVSGGYLYDRKLVEALRAAGDTVEIISLPWRHFTRHIADNFSTRLGQRLASGDFDLLLQDELNHPSLFWINSKLTRHAPFISIVHHLRSKEQQSGWKNRFYEVIEQRYLKSVDGFIFNSKTTRDTVFHLAKSDKAPHIVALPAGDRFISDLPISEAEIINRAHQPGPLSLIFVGNLIPRKGLHTLLTALTRLPAGQVELSIIGSAEPDPGYARKVLNQAAQPGLSTQVQYLGQLGDPDLEIRLRRAHLLIVPSFYEGYGIVYLEGMSFGLPAIAGRAGAAGEIITHGQDGFLVPPGEAIPLVEIISALAVNRRHLVALSLAARQRYLSQPTWDETSSQIRTFLQGLIR